MTTQQQHVKQAEDLANQILEKLRAANADPAVIEMVSRMNELARENPNGTSADSPEFYALERKFNNYLFGE